MSDTHGELYFARYDARNRLVTGGAVIGPGNKPERLKGTSNNDDFVVGSPAAVA